MIRSLIALSLFIIVLALTAQLSQTRIVPQCQEDIVLVGIGDFENGRWDSYICGPAVDDFEGYN